MAFRKSPMRDPSLPHQVVLQVQGHSQQVTVTCNCRNNAHLGPIGLAPNIGRTRDLYNDSANHVGPTPFTQEWKLTYG